jgi:DNA-binding CsgD family transcriptional regulator
VTGGHPGEHIASALEASAEALSYDELGGGAVGPAARAVSASNVLLYRYDDRGAVHGVAGTLAPALHLYSRELFEEDPVQRHLMGIAPVPRVVLTVHEMDRRAYRRSAAYTDFYRPHDMEHLLGMWLTDLPYGAPGMAGILFTRARGEPDFSERDAQILVRMVPALQAAARRIQRVERVMGERRGLFAIASALAPGAHVAFDTAGRPLWVSPEAEALLAPLLAGGRALPPALVEAAARAGLLAGGGALEAPPLVGSLALRCGALHADLRLARGPSGERIVVAALSPAAPAVPPEADRPAITALAAHRRLTPAETAVLGCLSEGLSNREIAASLFVSLETVKTHVQRILAKLGVASRTQAAVLASRGAPERSPRR